MSKAKPKRKKPQRQRSGSARRSKALPKTQGVPGAGLGEEPSENAPQPAAAGERFTAMETGAPDEDDSSGGDSLSGARRSRGPLDEEGEGDRQNDQLAELEEIPPNINSENE